MRVNDLTEESIRLIDDGAYVTFNEGILDEIIYFNGQKFNISNPYDGGSEELSLEEFKSSYKDCEMFPIESIKKPKE